MANLKIVAEAKRALTAVGYPTKNNLCQKWARMVVQKVVGHKFDAWLQRETAKKAAISLAGKGIAFPKSELAKHGGLQPGDLLYKTVGSGGNGHVGIYEDPQHVYENSSVHYIRSGGKDARGVRTLAQFGDFQYVARFPDTEEKAAPAPKPESEDAPLIIIWNGNPFTLETLIEKTANHDVKEVTERLDVARAYVNSVPKG